MLDLSLDIETMGLNPWTDRVVTAAFVGSEGDEIEVYDEEDWEDYPAKPAERELLVAINNFISNRPAKGLLVGWNHTEFDIPFLAVRMALHGILGPDIHPTGSKGKYGMPLYRGSWWAFGFRDVAYDFEQECKEAGIQWSLKPFAEYRKLAKGPDVDFSRKVTVGTKPCEHDTDFGGKLHEHDLEQRWFKITDLDREQRKLYCVSDAQMVMSLHLGEDNRPQVKGQAVLNEGSVTIL